MPFYTPEFHKFVISFADYEKYGCPACGEAKAYSTMSGSGTDLVTCGKQECGTRSSFGFGGKDKETIYPEVGPHPRAPKVELAELGDIKRRQEQEAERIDKSVCRRTGILCLIEDRDDLIRRLYVPWRTGKDVRCRQAREAEAERISQKQNAHWRKLDILALIELRDRRGTASSIAALALPSVYARLFARPMSPEDAVNHCRRYIMLSTLEMKILEPLVAGPLVVSEYGEKIMRGFIARGYVRLSPVLCGPLATPTGEMMAALTEAGHIAMQNL